MGASSSDARWRGLAKPLAVCAGGLLVGWLLFLAVRHWPALEAKLRGDAKYCSWGNVFRVRGQIVDFQRVLKEAQAGMSVVHEDEAIGAELLRTPEGEFWIGRGDGQSWSGKRLLASLIAEHTLIERSDADRLVRPKETVIDCGAHVGIFTHYALKRGASKVVAVEPDPVSLACLRRNLEREIADGQVVVVDKAAWSSITELRFEESSVSSAGNTVVAETDRPVLRIQATTIDQIVRDLHLPRVTFIKIDLEGSEREALKGAADTLREFRPRLMVAGYHRADDPAVVPSIILRAYPRYQLTFGSCEIIDRRLAPGELFFQP